MKITLTNDWKDGGQFQLFSMGWSYTRDWCFKLLGFTYYQKDPEGRDTDCRTLFFHLIDGHFYGKCDGRDEDYMFSIDFLNFGIIISWGKDSED